AFMTDAKLAGLEERFAEIKGVRMRYFVGGEGPPLILVHWLGGAAANWAELAPLLVRRPRRLGPALPGHAGPPARPAVDGPGRHASRYRGWVFRSPLLRRLVFGFVSVADPVGLTDEAVEGFLAAHLLHTDVNSAWRALRGDDPREELDAIRCPVLVLWGADDV